MFNNLTHNFKTYDHFNIDTGVATSVKSLDLMCPTYQNPKGLEQRLNRMKDQLLAGADKIKLPGDAPDKMHDVNGRILHLVFPDVPLTTEQTNVLTSFINNPDNKFEVIITIVTS